MNKKEKIELNAPMHIREKLLMLLAVLYIAFDLTCDVTAHRYVSFFSYTLIGSSLIYPLTYFINDIITEIFGFKYARNMIWLGVLADFIFSFLIIGINKLPSPHFWHLRESFIAVLDPMLRLNVGGLMGILVGRFLNIYLLSKTKVLLKGRFFWARSIFSTSLGICAHSIVLDIITFYGVVPDHQFLSIMMTNYLTNASSVLLFFWIPTIIVEIIKSKYHIDTYDEKISYNPISFR